MAQRNIDFGTFPDDPDADAIRTAFQKTQENFTEIFAGLQDQAVLSIKEGPGIVVSSPTGNVEITNKLAQVNIQSSTLYLGTGSPGGTLPAAATANLSSQTLFVELPTTVNTITTLNLANTLTANTVNVNLTINGNVASFTGNVGASNLSATGNATVTGNVNAGNINAGVGNFSGNINSLNANLGNLANANNLSVASNANITGNLTAGNANLGNLATANYFSGDGSLLTNVIAAPGNLIVNGTSQVFVALSGNITTTAAGYDTQIVTATGVNVAGYLTTTGNLTAANANLGNAASANYFIGNFYGTANSATTATSATTAGTVTTASQPNITSVGTLTSLTVTNKVTAGQLQGDGGNISNIQGANVSGAVASATSATTATTATSATTAGTVTTASQPNITSVGTLTSVNSSGNVTSPNIVANTGAFYGNAAGLTNIPGANVTGTVNSATTAGTVTANAQSNITSVGTLTSLDVTGNVVAGNVYANSGTVGASLLTGTLTTSSQPNITTVGTLGSLSVTGNITAGNIDGGNLVKANYIQGDGSLLTNVSVGAGSYIENGNSEVRVDASSNVRVTVSGNANVVVVTGTGANINGYANVTGNIDAGNVSATLLTGTLTTASQPNVTSLGTLTALTVNGIANLSAVGNVRISGGSNNQVLVATGTGANVAFVTAAGLTFAPGSNTQVLFNDAGSFQANANLTFDKTTGTLSTQALSVTANGTFGNVYANSGTVRGNLLTGTLTTAAQPNITSIGSLTSLIVSGNINAGNVSGGNLVSANYLAGTLTTAAQPNITSTGTLTGLNVNGNITAANITANTGVFTGNGSGLSQIAGANVTGTVANATYAVSAGSATTAGTVTTNAQPNITSVGALTGLTVSGTTNLGRTTVSSGTVTANTHALTVLQTWNNSSVQFSALEANIIDTASAANSLLFDLQVSSVSKFAVSKEGNVFFSGTITGNGAGLSAIAGANVTGTVANATYATSAGSATTATSATSATTAGTVTANSQPNITSVGTLTSLTVTNKVTAGQLQGDGGNISNIQGGNVSGAVASATAATNASAVLSNTSTNTTVYLTGTSSSANGNVSLEKVTGVYANMSNNSITATTFVGSLSGTATSATSATTAGTVTTNSQPNITSVGTLTSLAVTGNVTAGNVYANAGTIGALTLKGEGGNISNIQGANVSGAVASATSATSATTAGTVTTASQPNITSTGTLTSLTVSGNITAQANVTVSGYRIRSVGTGISAAGTVQGDATAITKEMNVVSTVASGAGVVLPTAVAGMAITITNTSANSLLVYPATNGIINSLSANAAFTQPAGATLQFIAPTTTQWYTVGATFA